MKIDVFYTIIYYITLSLLLPMISQAKNLSSTSPNIVKFVIGIEIASKNPLYNISQGAPFTGIYKDILEKFAKDNKFSFEYVPLTNGNSLSELYNNKIDFKFPDNPTWRTPEKRNYNFIYSDPISFYIEGIFVKPQRLKLGTESIKTLGMVGDTKLWSIYHYIENNRITVSKENKYRKLIIDTLKGKLDGVICDYLVMQYHLNQLGLKNSLILDIDLPYIEDNYYLSTINHPDIIMNFNIWLQNNQQFIKKLHDKILPNL